MLPIDVLRMSEEVEESGPNYWKIEFYQDSFPMNRFCSEIKMFTDAGGPVNKAIQGITGNAFSVGGTGGAAAVFDGNSATFAEWIWTQAQPLTIGFNFFSGLPITSFSWQYSLGGSSPSGGPNHFDLYSSADGISYDLIQSWDTSNSWTDGEVRTFNV